MKLSAPLDVSNIRRSPACLQRWSKWLYSICLLLLIAGCADAQNSSQLTASESSAAPSETAQNSIKPSEVKPSKVEPSEVEPSETEPSQLAMTGDEMIWAKIAQAEQETYVVLLRHAIAPGTGDPENFELEDCTTQRNLSESGRQQARDIGEAFRRRDIPIAKVLSSQWCRCLETAELMDVGPVEPFPALNSFFRDRTTADAQTNQIREYIANSQDQPGVIVMVTHQVNITALTSIFPRSGSAVVLQLEVQPDNSNQLRVIGQLPEPGT